VAVNEGVSERDAGVRAMMAAAENAARSLAHRPDCAGWHEVSGRGEYRLKSAALRSLAGALGIKPGAKTVTPAVERESSAFYAGFLRGLFDADGSVQGSQA